MATGLSFNVAFDVIRRHIFGPLSFKAPKTTSLIQLGAKVLIAFLFSLPGLILLIFKLKSETLILNAFYEATLPMMITGFLVTVFVPAVYQRLGWVQRLKED